MNNKFDELTKQMAQSVTRRQALRKFGLGLAGMALACLGLADKAGAVPRQGRQGYCQFVWRGFGTQTGVYTGMCLDTNGCVAAASADCPSAETSIKKNVKPGYTCLVNFDMAKGCSFT